MQSYPTDAEHPLSPNQQVIQKVADCDFEMLVIGDHMAGNIRIAVALYQPCNC